ncbi:hypothetical protein SAMN05444920_105597 [Nonomuraea solani]|uniref:WD40-like Beta Propeller Repeat n=1 Tax=Nonomuraea solani TaxID=1144553 RepID=A0A1H6DL22_9ACTN|nr:hypothetical protein [Nonomuraea solani]SEG85849.1 hypothetical protein SAMN05444920_105597 [Nonomuraea solani]
MIAAIAIALSLTLVPPAARADIVLPGTGGMKYQEKVDDPVRLTAYGLGTRRTSLRSFTGDTFTWGRTTAEVSVAPGGRLAAGVPRSYRASYDALILTDRTTGTATRVRTVKKPLTASYVSWSRDAKRIALTVEQKVGGRWRVLGFTIVDVATKRARTVRVPGLSEDAGFWWSPGGDLISTYGVGLRVYRASDGAVLRTLRGVGRPTGPEDAFSPSGARLATWCPARFKEQLCLVNPATGTIATRVNVRPEALFGWWDESHVIAVMAYGSAYRLSVVDLKGKVTRVLAAIPARTWAAELWLSFTRRS